MRGLTKAALWELLLVGSATAALRPSPRARVSAPRAISSTSEDVPRSVWLKQATVMWLSAAALGPVCDGRHSAHDVLHYAKDSIAGAPWILQAPGSDQVHASPHSCESSRYLPTRTCYVSPAVPTALALMVRARMDGRYFWRRAGGCQLLSVALASSWAPPIRYSIDAGVVCHNPFSQRSTGCGLMYIRLQLTTCSRAHRRAARASRLGHCRRQHRLLCRLLRAQWRPGAGGRSTGRAAPLVDSGRATSGSRRRLLLRVRAQPRRVRKVVAALSYLSGVITHGPPQIVLGSARTSIITLASQAVNDGSACGDRSHHRSWAHQRAAPL